MLTLDASSLARKVLSETDSLLLGLSLGEAPHQADLDTFLAGWNLDTAPMTEAVLVSYITKLHPDLQFPDNLSPRLAGLLRYCRFQYLQLVARFGKISQALKAEGIEFLVMKGGAMKALRPDFPRWMGDIDILVREKDYELAAGICESAGFKAIRSPHSIDLKLDGKNIIDIHRYIMMHTGKERAVNEGIFERSVPARIFSVEARMPSREDLMFITLVNLSRNLADRSSSDSIIYSFFDVRFLIEAGGGKPFDWSIVRKNGALSGSTDLLAYAAGFLDATIPGIVPLGELPASSPEALEKVKVWAEYRGELLRKEREDIGEFNILKALKGGASPLPYVWKRLRFIWHKRLEHNTSACRRILSRR